MGQFTKMFLMYGTIFAAVWIIKDVVEGETISDWWITALTAHTGAGIGAAVMYRFSKRNRS